jgi:hypothetical protein
MSEEFMKGYTRDVDTMGKLLSSLVKAMTAHPNLRLGQLLVAVLKPTEFPPSQFESVLFNIHDETLTKRLEAFATD